MLAFFWVSKDFFPWLTDIPCLTDHCLRCPFSFVGLFVMCQNKSGSLFVHLGQKCKSILTFSNFNVNITISFLPIKHCLPEEYYLLAELWLSFIYKWLLHLYLQPRSLIFWIPRAFFSHQAYTFSHEISQAKRGMSKMNLCSPQHFFDLLNFLSQQMASSSSIIHVRNLEVNRNPTPSLKSCSITKSCWVYHHKYI